MENRKLKQKEDRCYVIMDMSREHAYLHHFGKIGPVTKGSPMMFTKREADNILARARNAGWLVGDFEIFRF